MKNIKRAFAIIALFAFICMLIFPLIGLAEGAVGDKAGERVITAMGVPDEEEITLIPEPTTMPKSVDEQDGESADNAASDDTMDSGAIGSNAAGNAASDDTLDSGAIGSNVTNYVASDDTVGSGAIGSNAVGNAVDNVTITHDAINTAPVAGYDWGSLAGVAGATAFTLVVVQFIKAPLDKIWHIPTRFVVYIIAFSTLLIAQIFTSGFTADGVALTAVNAVIASSSAMGAYEMTFANTDRQGNE